MTWAQVARHLPGFETAVLTTVDDAGYPVSTRCRPVLDAGEQVLRIPVGVGVEILPGPAGLLCHRHDERLADLRSFWVRGTVHLEADVAVLRPDRFVPGTGMGGPLGVLRFVRRSRRTAERYLRSRGLPRPDVPWDEVDELRRQVRQEIR